MCIHSKALGKGGVLSAVSARVYLFIASALKFCFVLRIVSSC